MVRFGSRKRREKVSRRSEPSQPTPTAQARTAKQHRTQRRSEYHGGEMMGTESIFRAALAAVVFLACTLPGAVRATAQGSQLLYQHGQRSSFLRGSTADGDVIAKLRSPPLAVIPAASEEESFRFSQHGLSLKTMSLEPSNSQDAPSSAGSSAGTENSGSTGSATGAATGSASGAATGSASGAATGSASGAATGSASGAATGSASGAATGSASGAATGSASGAATGPAPTSSKNETKAATSAAVKAKHGSEGLAKKTEGAIASSGAPGLATGSEAKANKKEEAKPTVAKQNSSATSSKSASTEDAVTAASENKTTNSSASGAASPENVSPKVLKDMNQDLPKDDQFLTNSKDAIQAINDIAVEDNNSSKAQEPVAVGTSTEAHERALKVSNVDSDKEKVRLSDYEPQIIPELGGSIMVHKESRLPITFSPIVMPTVQEVDSLDKLKEVRTP